MLKPTTYVNCTGRSDRRSRPFLQDAPAEDLLVIVDDTALPCGTIRMTTKAEVMEDTTGSATSPSISVVTSGPDYESGLTLLARSR